MKNYFLSIWASGQGTNAKNIVEYFKGHSVITIEHILTNKKTAGVIQKADELKIPCYYFSPSAFKDGNEVLAFLNKRRVTHIVLAGFLQLVPYSIIRAYPDRIINIHPGLLPQYGGKGMYGKHVHRAVLQDRQKQSGITIHLVDEHYDHGPILFTKTIDINENETLESLEEKIHALEHQYYPRVIEQWVLGKLPI